MDPDDPTVVPAAATRGVDADTIVEGSGSSAEDDEDGTGALTPGTRMGRYVVLEEIGSGGMGMVFSAYDPELNRKVALKLLRPRHRERKRNRSRLLKEAQALAKLAHPNVITVYDVGTYGERVFVAMELVEGTTLKGWLRDTKRKWDEVLKVFIPAGRGLAAAHAANLVHRDFKPENVLIGRDGRVRVMDFGLARPMQSDTETGLSLDPDERAELEDAERDVGDVIDPLMTQTGSVLGTPAYMAPEQHLGKHTDARSDQFSFCTALYHALYGERPFDADDAATLAIQKAKGQIKDPTSGASVPSWVRRHVLTGLSAEPSDRFASMDALLDELSRDPRIKRRKIFTAVGTVGGMVGAVVAIQMLNAPPEVCNESAGILEAVWNEPRKAAAEAGVTSASGEHIAPTWATASAAIDAYGEAWVAMHTEACEATELRGEQSARLLELRNNCLQERLDEIDAWSEQLTDPSQPVATRAAHAALGLSPLSACADSEALASAVDPPQGEETKAAVAALRADLAKVKVLGLLGLYDQALELANSSYTVAGALEYPAVLAEARYRLGQAQGLRGDGEQSEFNLEEAAWKGASVKHDSIAAAAASELVHMVGRRMGDHEDGLAWSRHAEAAIKRIGVGGYMEARLQHDIGVIHDATGDLAQAEAALSKALELYASVDAADLLIIDAKRCLGDVRIHQGSLDEAQSLFDQARESTVELLGESHPEVALAEAGLARVADARGKHEAALASFASAIEKAERGFGPGDLDLVPLIDDLALSHTRRAEYEKAVEQKERAFKLLQDALGEHPRVASALYDIGSTLEAAGRLEAAREHHERALRMWESTRGEDHPDLAYALTSLGLLDVQSGEAKRAVERLERALKLRGGRGLDPQLLAQTQFALARALHATGGDQPRARELATKARDTFAKGKSPDPKQAEEIDRWLQATSKDKERLADDESSRAG